jgi:predicted Zn-dependent protease
MNTKYIIVIISLATWLFTPTACVTIQENPVSGNRRAFGYTWEQELQIGKEADSQIITQYGLYDDPKLSEYVTKVGELVLAQSHMRRTDVDQQFRNTKFTFRVLNSPIVNAFALPGGYVYVTRGLLTHLNNEAQLAVVLGHEIGHIAARHASQRAFEQQAGQIALIGGAILGEELLGVPAGDILGIGGTAAELLFLRYSRDHERESDRLGVEYSAMSGYQAAEGSAFFVSLKRLSEAAGGGLPSFLSSHPDPGDREQSIKSMSAEWANKGMSLEKVGQDEFLSMVDDMILGENPREGFVENGNFYHPDLKFLFPVPSNWTLVNESAQVYVVEKDQKAMVVMQVATDKNPQGMVEEFGKQEGMTTVSSGPLNINGLSAYQMITEASAKDGSKYRFSISGIQHEGMTYRFVGYTSADDYISFQGLIENISKGFRPLKDQRILDIKPVRVQLKTIERSTRFSELLPNPLPNNMKAEDLAILNQVQLSTMIPAGTKVKLPVQ